jgi:hypothetical protein
VAGEHEHAGIRPPAVQPPFGQVLAERGEHPHRATQARLRLGDLAEAHRGLDEQRALADKSPRERERLGPWTQPRVCEHGHERRVADEVAAQQPVAHLLDGLGRQRRDAALARAARVAHRAHRIRRQPLPLACALQDA